MSSVGNVRLFLGQPVGQRDCEWVGQQRGERTEKKNEKEEVFFVSGLSLLTHPPLLHFVHPLGGQGLLLTESKKLA